MPYAYDVFISYSSADQAWASKLESDLKAAGVARVYRDQSRLLPGAKWEDEIMTKVRDSQHLVVLWSKNSAATDWVRRERGNFEAATAVPGSTQNDRLLIFVRLDDEGLANGSLQVINDIKNAQVYGGGAENINPRLWRTVVDKVVAAIQAQDDATPIITAVLAATITEIQNLSATTLDGLVDELGIGTRQALFDFYEPGDPQNPKRTDWRPFGSGDTIETVLGRQQAIINRTTGQMRFRWEYVKNDFWDDTQAARRYADSMRERLSLIVIDPVSLSVDLVYRRASILKKCLANNETAVMVSTPFSPPRPFLKVRQLIKDNGSPFFDEYFTPPVHDMTLTSPAAAIGIYVGDEVDTERLLLATMGPYVRKHKSESTSSYIRI